METFHRALDFPQPYQLANCALSALFWEGKDIRLCPSPLLIPPSTSRRQHGPFKVDRQYVVLSGVGLCWSPLAGRVRGGGNEVRSAIVVSQPVPKRFYNCGVLRVLSSNIKLGDKRLGVAVSGAQVSSYLRQNCPTNVVSAKSDRPA